MQARTNLFDGVAKRMLHVAPEPGFDRALAAVVGLDRVTADLVARPGVMVRMDLTDIQCPDEQFDAVYCSHVLEHIPDDRRAMRELYRVLRPGGWALLQVPVLHETTIEDQSVTLAGRAIASLWPGRSRAGLREGFRRTIDRGGFDVSVDDFGATFSEAEHRYFGLMDDEAVYIGRKVPPVGWKDT